MKIISLTGIGVSLLVGLMVGVGDANSAVPGTGYELVPDQTFKSDDGNIVINQYHNSADYTWKIETVVSGKSSFLEDLPNDSLGQPSTYPGGFRLTKDKKWMIRMQKTGAGYEEVYLYRRETDHFIPAMKQPLSDLAWNFYLSQTSQEVPKPAFHIFATLVKGTEDNYRWMKVNWPDSRYLVLTLSAELASKADGSKGGYLAGWWCRYDLQTGLFDLPPSLVSNNANAVNRPLPR